MSERIKKDATSQTHESLSDEETLLPDAFPGMTPGANPYPFLSPSQQEDELGRLGGYRVLEVLGSGGMGVVFLAEDENLKRRVALKVLKTTLISDEMKERFFREARAMSAIRNDHVITVYQVDEDNGVPFLAMEYLEGAPLDQILKREGKLNLFRILDLGRQTARGLAAAHKRGLIHRDIKPANLWVEPTEDGERIKVLDFGLAKSLEEDVKLTQSGAMLGTPAFMSPEQVNGESVDTRTDLFSLGCVLYYMSSGELPFRSESLSATMYAVCHHSPRAVQELNADVPSALGDLIKQLLSKSASDRPPSAEDVAEQLTTIASQLTQQQTRAQTPPPPSTSVDDMETLTQKPDVPPAKNKRGLIVGALLTVLVLGGLAAFVIPSLFKKDANKPGSSKTGVTPPKKVGPPKKYLDRLNADDVPPSVRPENPPKELIAVLGQPELKGLEFRDVLFTPDQRFIFGARSKKIRIWDLKTMKELRPLTDHARPIDSLAISNDGTKLASGDVGGKIRLWDLTKDRPASTTQMTGHTGPILTLAFSPDGKTLASGSMDKTVHLWDVSKGPTRGIGSFTAHNDFIDALVFSPDGKSLATVGRDKSLRLWDLSNGKPRERGTIQSFRSPLLALAFTSDGTTLICGGMDMRVHLVDDWKTRPRIKSQLKGARASISAVVAKGTTFYTGDTSGGLLEWRDEKVVRSWKFAKAIHGLALSRDGRYLATANSGGTIYVFRVQSR